MPCIISQNISQKRSRRMRNKVTAFSFCPKISSAKPTFLQPRDINDVIIFRSKVLFYPCTSFHLVLVIILHLLQSWLCSLSRKNDIRLLRWRRAESAEVVGVGVPVITHLQCSTNSKKDNLTMNKKRQALWIFMRWVLSYPSRACDRRIEL